jgi:hypothetical protein
VTRLEQLDAVREDLVELLAELRTAMGEDDSAPAPATKPHLRAAHRVRPATG